MKEGGEPGDGIKYFVIVAFIEQAIVIGVVEEEVKAEFLAEISIGNDGVNSLNESEDINHAIVISIQCSKERRDEVNSPSHPW